MRHGREESGRLGFRGQLTRRHPPPLPSPLSPPLPLSPSLSDEATSPLMPPPPRDAALLRLTPPPPPSRRTPPRRTGCHLLRPVVSSFCYSFFLSFFLFLRNFATVSKSWGITAQQSAFVTFTSPWHRLCKIRVIFNLTRNKMLMKHYNFCL